MRNKLIVFTLVVQIVYSCVKQKTTNPVPVVDYGDFLNAHKKPNGNDTATLMLNYEDGDGDLFLDNSKNGPNLIFTSYYFNKTKNVFDAHFIPGTSDTLRYSVTITQPDNGSYKGKSINGEIYVPMNSFRYDNTEKVIKFRGFMTDSKGHNSNTFSSPTISLGF